MENVKQKLIKSALLLDKLGLSKVGPGKGSFSVFNDEDNCIYITPSGKSYFELEENDIVVVDSNGNVLNGSKPSVDIIFHKAIYENRNGIKSVIHLHSPYATSFALLREEIPVCMQVLANTIGGPIPVSDFALPGTQELCDNIVKAMDGKKNAVLMASHGLVVCEATPEKAVILASTVEDAAQSTAIAKLMGKPYELSKEEIEGALNFYQTNFR